MSELEDIVYHLDSMEQELGNQLALEIEKRGDDSIKVRELRKKIEAMKREPALTSRRPSSVCRPRPQAQSQRERCKVRTARR